MGKNGGAWGRMEKNGGAWGSMEEHGEARRSIAPVITAVASSVDEGEHVNQVSM